MPLYFAYDSNLLARRLRADDRAPSAELVATAMARGHDLRFHKLGKDGSGKCDLVATPSDSDVVWGVVWRVSVREFDQLDRCEQGYRRRSVYLTCGTDTLEAETYQALSGSVVPTLLPFDWYRDVGVAGARERGLPVEWIRRLEQEPAMEDPDTDRRARFRALLR